MFTFKVHGNIDDELLLAAHPPPGLGLPPHVAAKQQAAAEHQRKQHQPLVVQQAAPVVLLAAPAVGGAAPEVFVSCSIPVGPASSWSVNDMVKYLAAIALGHLSPIIRENGLDGAFFLQCAQDTGGLASHWHWTGAVEENQDVYATVQVSVTSRPLAAMPAVRSHNGAKGPFRPRDLTAKHVRVKGGAPTDRLTYLLQLLLCLFLRQLLLCFIF